MSEAAASNDQAVGQARKVKQYAFPTRRGYGSVITTSGKGMYTYLRTMSAARTELREITVVSIPITKEDVLEMLEIIELIEKQEE